MGLLTNITGKQERRQVDRVFETLEEEELLGTLG